MFPRRAATRDCTRSSSCSCNALKSSSLLAKAYVSLPVVRLIFIGGSTFRSRSMSANLRFDIKSFLSVTPASRSSLSLRSCVSSKCCSNNPRSRSSIGSINIRSVTSISFNSVRGKLAPMILNSLYVSSTSCMQYSPYFLASSAVKSARRLPLALCTSKPFSPIP